MPEARHLEFLQHHGAMRSPHTAHTLLSHLEGTSAILTEWGERQALCDAGLFHSVYGTESYTSELIPQSLRADVQSLIGIEAERLAHFFGRLEKEPFYRHLREGRPILALCDRVSAEPLPISHQDCVDVCHLMVANWLEQRPRAPESLQFTRREEFAAMRRLLRPAARRDLDEAYRFAD